MIICFLITHIVYATNTETKKIVYDVYMNKRCRYIFLILLAIGVALSFSLLLFYLLKDSNFAVLETKGLIAKKERDLLLLATAMSMVVIIPVYIMTFVFARKYRASNTKAKYRPDWDHSILAETIWWTVPMLLIGILGVMTWRSSYDLNPYKPIDSDVPPITIQVVALDWKWLFIYPDHNIATVNYVQFPSDTPIIFQITSDAPMNSFWIPQLGGQIYAMTGMKTQLNLIADDIGSYDGLSANISGRGFSGMKFKAVATTKLDYDKWVQNTKATKDTLDKNAYSALAMPSENNPVKYYGSADSTLYDWIVMKYLMPQTNQDNDMKSTNKLPHIHTEGMEM